MTPPLLLIHGNPERASSWARFQQALPATRPVIVGTLPGFDGAAIPARDCTLEKLADAAATWVPPNLAAEPVIIVGHSHGGAVALEFARRWPERVRGLVLVASVGATPHVPYRLLRTPIFDPVIWGLRGVLRTRWLAPLSRSLLRISAASAFSPESVPSDWIEDELAAGWEHGFPLLTMARVVHDDPCGQVRRMASTIHVPVLVIHGTDDGLVPYRIGKALAALLPNAVLVPIGGAGHMLPYTHPARLNTAIEAWERSAFGV